MHDTSRDPRTLLRAALDLLDDDHSLIAAAMVEGALSVLEREAVAAPAIDAIRYDGRAYGRAEFSGHRSCA
jgi:hypothetical protein